MWVGISLQKGYKGDPLTILQGLSIEDHYAKLDSLDLLLSNHGKHQAQAASFYSFGWKWWQREDLIEVPHFPEHERDVDEDNDES